MAVTAVAMSAAAVSGVTMLQLVATAAAPQASEAARSPVLGSKMFAGPIGVGWGAYKPSEIFNGGDPSGMVKDIVWSHWGEPTSLGIGKTWIFKPGGGYFPGTVTAELHASNLGHCTANGPLAYRHLDARVPSRPRGKLGAWFAWSGATTLCKPAF